MASNTSNSTPAWLWWLIAAVVVGLAIVIALVLRRRSRKRAWARKFAATKGEVAWFARELIPQLGQAPTAAQIAGGWRIEASRIVAIEDRLTALEADAVDDVSSDQAHALRDAVRASRTRLAALDTTGDTAAAQNLLRSAATVLETALATDNASVYTAQGEATPR